MVWLVWAYTTWVTNWLDPERIAVRLLLLGLAGASLVMSAALPGAFSARGLAVGVAYAVMQIGRSVFAVVALRGRPLQRNFQRILAWCLVSGALAVLGGLAAPDARAALWVAAVGVDLLGGAVGFYTPGLGRSTTREWTIEGGHFAERCQAFILIALGESIVVIGATLSGLARITGAGDRGVRRGAGRQRRPVVAVLRPQRRRGGARHRRVRRPGAPGPLGVPRHPPGHGRRDHRRRGRRRGDADRSGRGRARAGRPG